MVELLMGLLTQVDPDTLSDGFIAGTLAIFFYALYVTAKGKHPPFIQFAPTLLTTLGILGTFVGISIGLGNFSYDSQAEIDKSIPLLLGGLKMAFLTSVVGMSTSLLARIYATWKAKVGQTPADTVDVGDIYATLQAQHEALLDLRRAIAGEGDATVVTQLQKVRADINDGLRDTRRLLAPEGQKSVAEHLDSLAVETRTLGTALHEDLKGITTQQTEVQKWTQVIADTSEKTRRAIAGEGDTSLVTQLQRARSDLQEGFTAMRDGVTELQKLQTSVLAEVQGSSALQSQTLQAVGGGFDNLQSLVFAGQGKLDHALGEIRADLKDFAQKVSELGSKALIEALSDVIRDFNQNLTDQFGDNFKRLDESVGKLLEWQDNYKGQMADMKAGLEVAVAAVQASRDALVSVRKDAEAIPSLMGKLEDVITAAVVQLDDMERHLKAFAEVRDKAVAAVPQIQQALDKVMGDIDGAVRTATEHHNKLIKNSDKLIADFTTSATGLHQKFVSETDEMIAGISTQLKGTANEVAERNKQASESLKSAGKALEDGMKGVKDRITGSVAELEAVLKDVNGRMQEGVTRAFNEHNTHLQQLTRALRDENQKAASERTDLLRQEAQQLDEAMQAEITRVMQQMGNTLAQITNKFVTDYRTLTEAMGEVVAQGRRLSREGRAP